jgi:hypothetical protein
VAKQARLIEQRDGRFLVEFKDGSRGWHDGPLLPIEVMREALTT